MAQYENLPMDFADATLVALAEDTGIRDILAGPERISGLPNRKTSNLSHATRLIPGGSFSLSVLRSDLLPRAWAA